LGFCMAGAKEWLPGRTKESTFAQRSMDSEAINPSGV
jgi:hypothetical protein